jgi:hypothetical protein
MFKSRETVLRSGPKLSDVQMVKPMEPAPDKYAANGDTVSSTTAMQQFSAEEGNTTAFPSL